MQTELLFELTYIILDRKNVTAKEMAEHFCVSQRTIYRWVDALDLAGVPIVTTKGKGGGIQLAEKYTLDKAVLTEEEKFEILSSVQALQVLSGNSNSAVSKLKAITKANTDWIKIDFAPWNPKYVEIRDLFNLIKTAILSKRQINCNYYSSKGECTNRTIEPWKIIFRGQAWYLLGFCQDKNESRYFKLSRVQNCVVLEKKITHEEKDFPSDQQDEVKKYSGYSEDIYDKISLTLQVKNESVYRILDEFSVDEIEDGFDSNHKIIKLKMPEIFWLKNWLLSFGAELKILEPLKIREELQNEIKKMLEL